MADQNQTELSELEEKRTEEVPMITVSDGQQGDQRVSDPVDNTDGYPLAASEYWRMKIKEPEQTCCIAHQCCSLWWGAHFWLLIQFVEQLTILVLYCIVLTVLYDDYGTHIEEGCDVNTDPYQCDLRKQYEGNSWDDVDLKAFVTVGIVIAAIATVINLLAFFGLHYYNRCFILMQVIYLVIKLIWRAIWMIVMRSFFYVIIDIVVLSWSVFVFYSVYKWMKIADAREEGYHQNVSDTDSIDK
eukprot:56535_1